LDFEKLPEMPKNSSLKISSWNVNGLRAQINKGSFEKFVKGGKLFKILLLEYLNYKSFFFL